MRKTGDWLLAALGVLTLLIFAVFLWWFGPWHAPLGFGIWAVLSSSLLVVAYRRTRSRWLLYLGTGLLPCGLVVGTTAADSWSWGSWDAWYVLATNALTAALPLAITITWVWRMMRPAHGPQDRWTI